MVIALRLLNLHIANLIFHMIILKGSFFPPYFLFYCFLEIWKRKKHKQITKQNHLIIPAQVLDYSQREAILKGR